MIKSIIQWLAIGTIALASNPEPSNKFKFGDGTPANKTLEFNRGANNPQIRWNESGQQLEFTNDGTNYSGIGSGSGSGGGGINILSNSDFESGISLGWTNAGGAFLSVSSGANVLFGKKSATFQAFGAGNYMESTLYPVPSGLGSQNCSAGIWYLGGDNNLVLEALDGSSNVLGSRTLTATTIATPFFTSFICPAFGGSFKLRVISTGASALVALDTMFLGQNTLLSTSTAQFIGSAFIPTTASCAWNNTSSTLAAFTTTSACPGPTVESNPGPGVIQTTDTDLPQFTVNSLPPGLYEVLISGSAGNTGGNGNNSVSISDGTNLSGNTGGGNVANVTNGFSVHGYFTYTSTGNRTFSLFGATTGSTLAVYSDNGAKQLYFSIKRFPLAQDQAIRPDMLANSWSGYHNTSCSWNISQSAFTADFPFTAGGCDIVQRTNRNFGTVTSANDGTPGNQIPGVVFTPSNPGRYYVCASFGINGNSLNQGMSYGLFDETPTQFGSGYTGVTSTGETEFMKVCGILDVASANVAKTVKIRGAVSSGSTGLTSGSLQSIDWNIFKLDQPLPAPVLVNSVVSNSNGVEVTCRGIINNLNPGATINSSSNCVASVNYISAGVIQINFSANTFSGNPACTCASQNSNHCCAVGNSGSGTVSTVTSAGFESHITGCSSGTPSEEMVFFTCIGPK